MKSEKFKTLAERRVNGAIKQIQLVGNLANINSYEYTDDQVRKIFSALDNELKSVKSKFKNAGKSDGYSSFTL